MTDSTRRVRRTFTEDFKKQMLLLHQNGKPRAEIIKEYDLTKSTFDRWIQQYTQSGSFKQKDNRSEAENDILKQATLIIGRK